MVVVAQLIAEVKTTGADTTAAQLAAVSAASDASSVSLGSVVTASTALSRNMTELSAMTAEGAAAADVAAVSTDTMNAAMAGAIPTTAALDAQFAAMRARLVEVGVAADAEAGQMRLNYVAHKALADAAGIAGKALAGLRDVMVTLIEIAAKVALVAGAIALVIGVVAAKAAADFQQNLLKLYTTAGEAKNALAGVGKGILDMSVQVGTGANELLKAMYYVESAGFHGASGLNVLKIAAEAAKAENSDLIGVAHALTGVLVTYASTGITAAQAMNVLIGSVSQGSTTLNDLSSAMSNVLPAGSKFHLQLIDLTTAIATMTNQNDNAASAATHLRQVILALESPAKAGAKALAEIGISSEQLSAAMRKSLPGAIQMIIDDLGKRFPEGSAAYNEALKAIAGGNKQLMGLLELSGTSLAKWKAAVKAVTGDVKSGGDAVMGWADVQKNFNFQMDAGKAALEKLGIQVGTLLLPVLTSLLQSVIPVITSFTDWWTNSDNLTGVLNTLTYYLQPLISAVQDTWTYLQPLIQGVIDWAQKNDVAGKALVVVQAAVQIFAAALRFIVPIIVQVIQAVIQFVSALWDRLGPAILTIVDFIRTHWTQISAIFSGVWNEIVGVIKIAWAIISGIILVGIDILSGHWGKAWEDIKQTLVNIWEGIKQALFGAVHTILGYLALIPGAIGDMAKAGLKWLDSLNTGAKKSAIDTQKAVVANIQAMVTSLQTQLDNATSASQRAFIKMKLDAAQQSLAMQQAVLKNMQGTADGVNTQTGNMAKNADANAKRMHDNVIKRLIQLNDDAVGHSIIPDMISKIGKAFTDMAAAALSWGSTLIDNFKAGLQAAWAGLMSWVNTALANLAAMFPASPVKAGPLKGSEKWGYTFIKNIADGMAAGMPLIHAAMAGLLGGTMGSMNISHSFSGGLSSPPAFMGSGGGQPVIINKIYVSSPDLYIDKHKLTDIMGESITNSVITQTGFRRFK